MAKGDSLDTFAAIKIIVEAIERVSEADRVRVLSAVHSLLGTPVPLAPPPPPAPAIARAAGMSTRPLSLVEMMQDKSPATIAQKIALFAFYRERVEALPRFSREDLKGYFAVAKETPPGNYDRDFATAVRQGWIHEDGSESYLTSRGLETVEAGFGGKAAPRGRHAASKGKKKNKKK